MKDNEFVAIGDSVVDFVYEDRNSNHNLVRDFFNFLFPDNPPSKGETRMLNQREWCRRIPEYGVKHGLITRNEPGGELEIAQKVISQIFGKPTISAGCATANIFDGIVKSKINDKPIINGLFVSSVGECESGQIFIDSFENGTLLIPERAGTQTEVHAFQLDGDDRIILGRASVVEPSKNRFKPEILDQINFSNTKYIMLDGYMIYAGIYAQFAEKICDIIQQLPEEKRPTIIMNTATQQVAGSSIMQNVFHDFAQLTKVIIVANLGELEAITNYEGGSKSAHEFAYDNFCANTNYKPIEFMVTDGSRPVHIINNNEISCGYATKKPPLGIKNTVGAGDNFTAGYITGKICGLPQAQCIEIGSTAASFVIGQDAARLPFKQLELNGKNFEGLPAYLMSVHEEFLTQRRHGVILENLSKAQSQSKAL